MSRATSLGGVIGNVMEWYDFALYGYFASVFAKQFFPSDNHIVSLIASFGVFAAGFLMRPIGAALFGHIGDRYGRKKTLTLSVVLMAIPTFVLGCLPTYAQIGVAAPILLTLVRLVQGLSVGGEFTGSVTYVVESAPANRRGLAGSWTNTGAMVGLLVGSGAAALINGVLAPKQIEAWGWRVPFLAGLLIGMVGFAMRRGLPESPEFEKTKGEDGVAEVPLTEAFRHHWRSILKVSMVCWGYAVLFYLAFVYLPTYEATFLGMRESIALDVNTLAQIGVTLLIPCMGLLSDRLSPKRLLLTGFALTTLLTYPLFLAMDHATFGYVLAAQLVFAVMVAIPLGVAPVALSDQFPPRLRLSGYSVAYNISMGVFGGTAPMIVTWLAHVSGDKYAPAWYLAASAAISLIAVFFLSEREPAK